MGFLIVGVIIFAATLGFFHLCGVSVLKAFVGIVLTFVFIAIGCVVAHEITIPVLILSPILAAAAVISAGSLRAQ